MLCLLLNSRDHIQSRVYYLMVLSLLLWQHNLCHGSMEGRFVQLYCTANLFLFRTQLRIDEFKGLWLFHPSIGVESCMQCQCVSKRDHCFAAHSLN
ncbi:hypothetical protein BRADI_5g16752v3 [Brachypodium distachyon]|uniref:Uncharacterized protein n=1 Tax=Brachypodium distachyon TaxID=15368 RepID=A0A0Q3E7A4_BRADI|nr:hypothetical protein BRADI_5g16752v3 [Brachypodium distachyon]